ARDGARPAPSDGSPARIPAPQCPGRGCRLTARPATFACVTVPAWSDSVTDHGQEYVTELASGVLRGTNPANAADRLRAGWRPGDTARPSRAGRRADNDAARRAGKCGPMPPPRCPDHRLARRGGQRDRREGALLVQPDD